MKLLLINPVNKLRGSLDVGIASKRQPLSLAIIAALTPSHWTVEIVDENFEEFQYRSADLVGLTTYTSTVFRAYEIAQIYRKKKIHTIIGGIHVSALPDEAEAYVDTVVIGEAESIWASVINDFENGVIKKRYEGEFINLDKYITPRYDLLDKRYLLYSVQTSRGCPMNCIFCSVTKFNGNKYRQRPITDIIDELERIKRRLIFFVDDNILGHGKAAEERARQLFQSIIDRKLNLQWASHASLNFANDTELLKLAAKSGCKMIFIGIEAETVEALKEYNKKLNLSIGVEQIKKKVNTITRHGISVIGGFMYGCDSDTMVSLIKRTEFISKTAFGTALPTVYTPLPGTRLYENLKNENRIIYNNYPTDWQRYDLTHVVFKHMNLSEDELDKIMKQTWKRLYSIRNTLKRTIMAWYRSKSLNLSIWVFHSNNQLRKSLKKL